MSPAAVLAVLGWGAAAFLARMLHHCVRAEAQREVARGLRERPRLSDTPHMRRAQDWRPEP